MSLPNRFQPICQIPTLLSSSRSIFSIQPMSWAESVTVTLATHISQVSVLLKRAQHVWFENDYYHPYDFALNFNALRKSNEMDFFLSVYPQARFSWKPPSDRVPANETSDKEAEHDDDSTSTYRCCFIQSCYYEFIQARILTMLPRASISLI